MELSFTSLVKTLSIAFRNVSTVIYLSIPKVARTALICTFNSDTPVYA